MKRRGTISQKTNNILFFLAGALAVVCLAVIGVGVAIKVQSAQQEEDVAGDRNGQAQNPDLEEQPEEKWQEGDIYYKGDYYRYNFDIRNYLLMGVDNDGVLEQAEDGVSGGQSDAMFLLVMNNQTQTLSVVSINRNTMAEIELYDDEGVSLGTMTAQICLQHGFGDGRKLSCTRSVDAVSKLFYQLPIDGYVAINMGAIPLINDAIGGVDVEVLQDLDYPEYGVQLTQGEYVTLNGQEAYCYLRGRNLEDFDSATDRLRREEQYLIQFANKMQSVYGKDSAKVVDIYNAAADYMESDIDFSSLVSSLLSYDFSEERMYTVPGETDAGAEYEEYYVDEDAFYDLIIQLFYEKVE